MTKDFEQFMLDVKWEIGNQCHIWAGQKMAQLRKNEATYMAQKKAGRNFKHLLEDILRMEEHIRFLCNQKQ